MQLKAARSLTESIWLTELNYVCCTRHLLKTAIGEF